jgi:hypothetical protein
VNAPTLRYRRTDILLDYGRAALGGGLSGTVLAAQTSPLVATAAGSLTALFAVFAVRTILRQIIRYEVSSSGIAATSWRKVSLDWAKLDRLKLRYYAPRRKRAKGWMCLTLHASGQRLSVDSTLPEFERIAALAVAAAQQNGVVLDDFTIGNLAALQPLPHAAAERS